MTCFNPMSLKNHLIFKGGTFLENIGPAFFFFFFCINKENITTIIGHVFFIFPNGLSCLFISTLILAPTIKKRNIIRLCFFSVLPFLVTSKKVATWTVEWQELSTLHYGNKIQMATWGPFSSPFEWSHRQCSFFYTLN